VELGCISIGKHVFLCELGSIPSSKKRRRKGSGKRGGREEKRKGRRVRKGGMEENVKEISNWPA
jgi:hypothetical protein